MWYIWLIIAGVFFVAEIITVGFFIFWLGIGALIAMLVSLFTSNLIIQTSVFVISSAILIFFTRPLVNKFVNRSSTVNTNFYSLIGKTGLVIEDISSTLGTGQVKVAGEVWSAKTETDDIIEKGTKVKILEVEGVKLVVTPKVLVSESK